MMVHKAFISVGSNLGDPLRNCCRGVDELCLEGDVQLVAHSPFYRTQPVDYLHQEWFVNAALLVDRLAGLRSTSQLTAEVQGNPQAPAFAPAQWRDREQRIWQALDLATLAADERFLKVFR